MVYDIPFISSKVILRYPFYTTPIPKHVQIGLNQVSFGPCFGMGGGTEKGVLEAFVS